MNDSLDVCRWVEEFPCEDGCEPDWIDEYCLIPFSKIHFVPREGTRAEMEAYFAKEDTDDEG